MGSTVSRLVEGKTTAEVVFLLFKFVAALKFVKLVLWLKQSTKAVKPSPHPGSREERENFTQFPSIPEDEFENRFVATREMLEKEFDFIIVGAGPAGCTLARKLSSQPDVRVLLIEAGGEAQNSSCAMSPYKVPTLFGSEVSWGYLSTPQPQLKPEGRIISLDRGRSLGGTSIVNYCMFVRGAKEDFDGWVKEFGLDSTWSYNNVVKNFQNLETVTKGSLDPHHEQQQQVSEVRGKSGPLKPQTIFPPAKEIDAFIAAMQSRGYKKNPDYNAVDQEGVGYTQFSTSQGRRSDAFSVFVEPILSQRPNLTVVSECFVNKVIVEGKSVSSGLRAVGVEVTLNSGHVIEVKAIKEVILCAGAISSPQILMLSGIGEKKELAQQGIEVKADIPAVGKHLQDHPLVSLPVLAPEEKVKELEKKRLQSTGPSGVAFVKSPICRQREQRLNLPIGPDFEVLFLARLHPAFTRMAVAAKLDKLFPAARAGETVAMRTLRSMADSLAKWAEVQDDTKEKLFRFVGPTVVLHGPVSRGTVKLRSSQAFDHPLVDCAWLREKEDLEAMLWAVKEMRELLKTSEVKQYVSEIEPLPHIHWFWQNDLETFFNATDDQLRQFILSTAYTTWHYSCTARMGSDNASLEDAVLDSHLRVRGVSGLRVADCSSMPRVVSANTNAFAMMIGDKCGDFLLADHTPVRSSAPSSPAPSRSSL